MTMLAKKLLVTAMAVTVLLGGCASSETPPADAPSTPVTTPAETPATEDVLPDVSWEENDRITDAADAVTVTLADDGSVSDGDGVTAENNVILIQQGGTYRLTGALTDGQLRVEAADTVHLLLDGVSVHSETSAPLYVKKADKVILTLVDGTENTFSDSVSLAFDDAEKEEPSAAVFSKADLTINGGGKLTVNASFRDGIVSRDGLKIADGVVNVSAADDALMGRDYVLIGGGTLTLQADGDGIKSTNDAGTDVGFVMVEGGTLNVVSGADGIQSESSLTVLDGDVTVTAGGGWEAASPHAEEFFGWGQEEETTDDETVGKGLKAQTALTVSGGNVVVNAADDALHANGNIAIKGGETDASSGDDGVHADGEIRITDGTLTVSTCYEGLEAARITLDGGDVSLTASDDGINASSGTSSGRNPMASDGSSLVINGGTLYVDAKGDGIDSNGTIHMTGGNVAVLGPSDGANGTLDFAESFTVTGGSLTAVGSTGMAQTPSVSGQNSIAWAGFSAGDGDTFTVTDAEGNVLASLAVSRNVSWAYVTSSSLKTGDEVTVSCGDDSQTIVLDEGVNQIGDASTGGFGGGRPGGDFTPPDGDFTPQRPDGMPSDFPDGDFTPPAGRYPFSDEERSF